MGTSFSACIVAGIIALMYTANPQLKPKEVNEIIKVVSDEGKIDNEKNIIGRRLNSLKAINSSKEYSNLFMPINKNEKHDLLMFEM